ncbi:4,5-DOPA dioxygenase extradiol [Psittacicella gerlachiana]|uniref:4,5-DOPA dioxygenase extradiol n=2 Tax=Psittacicella gerlachiana TaxID=2028574 RepID=A0A3A1YBM0_9GAMM|nr:4,5-DOPA dioxygenase extradiol [Psittacicella gerlachiana]
MPVLFVGHGSPMHAINDNAFTQQWQKLGEQIGKPKAILAISAHWYTSHTAVQATPVPQQIYDMYGFPQALYDKKYPAVGDAQLSMQVLNLLAAQGIQIDNSWGIDHGIWSILVHMYPQADVPVVQLSINQNLSPQQMYALGQQLQPLRQEGILILTSGNIVHNLRMMVSDRSNEELPWAKDFDNWMRDKVLARDLETILNYEQYPYADLAAPTPDHMDPLFYALGATREQDQVTVFNDARELGSLSMTSFMWHEHP